MNLDQFLPTANKIELKSDASVDSMSTINFQTIQEPK